MPSKQSKAALIQLIETGIRDVADLPTHRFYVGVQDIVATGSPPTHIVAFTTFRFLPTGTPFCCGEPGCYSSVFSQCGEVELGDYLRRKVSLRHEVAVELKVTTEYFPGIEFTELP